MIIQRILIALTSLILTVCGQLSPIITAISQDEIVRMGQTISLFCSVQYAEKYPVMWIKKREGDDLFISSGGSVLFPNQRYSVKHDSASNTYTLQISGLNQNDYGAYQCRIQIGPTTEVTAEVYVTVTMQPTISDNSTRSVLKDEGAFVELFCHASGIPVPTITWHREDNRVLPTGAAIFKGNTLRIYSIRKEDRGTYFCVADNGVARGAKRNIRVDVEFAPVIYIQRLKVGQALGYDMDLQCTVEAYPSPSIEWIKDNDMIVDNQHYAISNFATADQTTDTTLRIITIQNRQYGKYSCRATNKLGTAEESMQLFRSVVPVCPPACDILPGSRATIAKSSMYLMIQAAILMIMFCIL